MIKAKPAEQLAAALKDVRATNETLGKQVTDLTLSNMQLNSTLDTLGATLAQAQLDLMALKGGTS